MKLVQASEAIRLSGLTAHQLREWCGRRAVVVPDVPAAGRGRHALFSWQTILSLRILNELHDRFGTEVSAWRQAIAGCQEVLRGRSFPSLWGASMVFLSTSEARLIQNEERDASSYLVVPLDPHLHALASDDRGPLGLQLPLFAALRMPR